MSIVLRDITIWPQLYNACHALLETICLQVQLIMRVLLVLLGLWHQKVALILPLVLKAHMLQLNLDFAFCAMLDIIVCLFLVMKYNVLLDHILPMEQVHVQLVPQGHTLLQALLYVIPAQLDLIH